MIEYKHFNDQKKIIIYDAFVAAFKHAPKFLYCNAS
jgi:hypothetical protein